MQRRKKENLAELTLESLNLFRSLSAAVCCAAAAAAGELLKPAALLHLLHLLQDSLQVVSRVPESGHDLRKHTHILHTHIYVYARGTYVCMGEAKDQPRPTAPDKSDGSYRLLGDSLGTDCSTRFTELRKIEQRKLAIYSLLPNLARIPE